MNYEDIKKLIEDMGNSKIDSLDIEFPEGMKISMKKNETKEKLTKKEEVSQINISTKAQIEEKTTSNCDENLKIVTSPMVGTFYESSSPKEAAFVKIGDKVKEGDILCIVEDRKIRNIITC